MTHTYHHRHQRKRQQMLDPRPRRKERWPETLDTTFTAMPLATPSYIEPQDWLYVDVGPGIRISQMDQVAYVADGHAPNCVHVFRRNVFVMIDTFC
jgi:hypothetical protein